MKSQENNALKSQHSQRWRSRSFLEHSCSLVTPRVRERKTPKGVRRATRKRDEPSGPVRTVSQTKEKKSAAETGEFRLGGAWRPGNAIDLWRVVRQSNFGLLSRGRKRADREIDRVAPLSQGTCRGTRKVALARSRAQRGELFRSGSRWPDICVYATCYRESTV